MWPFEYEISVVVILYNHSRADQNVVQPWGAATGAALQTFRNCCTSKLVFSTKGPYLETNQGSLHIQPNCTGIFAPESQAHCAVYIKGNWITQGGKDLLWLPPDCRPARLVF
jgi:hypothetical protein